MKTTKLALFLTAVALCFSTEHLLGQIAPLFIHSGASNPTNEGFTLLRSGIPSVGPVVGDQGFDAWHIGLSSSSDLGQYYRNFSPQQLAEAANGWILSLTVRVLPPYQSPAFSFGTFGEFLTGTKSFALLLGAQPSGDPLVQIGNIEYSLIGGGSGYHTYQLRFDAILGDASLWVDGSERLGGLTGIDTLGPQRFSWGAGQNPYGTLAANWSEASFTIIPEPSATLIGTIGGIIAASRFVRRRAQLQRCKSI